MQGNYAWQGDAITLLALLGALWCLQWVKPVQGDRSKKCYFQHLQAFFHLPVLDDPLPAVKKFSVISYFRLKLLFLYL